MIKEYLNKLLNEGKVGDLLTPMTDKEYKSRVSPQMYKIQTMIQEVKDYLVSKGFIFGTYGPYPERYKKGEFSFRIYNQIETLSMDMLNHDAGNRTDIIPYTSKMGMTDEDIKSFKDKTVRAIDSLDVDVRVKNESVGDLLVPMSKEEQESLPSHKVVKMLQPIYKYLEDKGYTTIQDKFKYPIFVEMIKGKYLIEFTSRFVTHGVRLWIKKYKDCGGSWEGTEADDIFYGVIDSDLDCKNAAEKIMKKLENI
jgi:hypothetical protein